MKLNPNEEKFVVNYFESGNGTQSYLKAYGETTVGNAAVQASALLRKPKIMAALDTMMENQSRDTIADAVEVMEYYTAVMRGELKETVLLKGSQLVEREPLIAERTRAAEQLSKRFGLDQSSLAKSLEVRKLELMAKQVELAIAREQGDEAALEKLDAILDKIGSELNGV